MLSSAPKRQGILFFGDPTEKSPDPNIMNTRGNPIGP
jgi:hypothetical protein